MAKEGKYATLRLPSGEMRMVPIICRASIGVVGNGDHNLICLLYTSKNKDTLTLGKHELTFVFAPMVHWPEVMVTSVSYTHLGRTRD